MADQQLTVFETEFSLDNWRLEGKGILEDVAEASHSDGESAQRKNSLAWRLADWLLYGHENLKVHKNLKKNDRQLEAEVKKVNRSIGHRTIWDYIRTAKAFPESRRRDSVSWSHHKEIATKNFDDAARDRLLDQAEAGKLSIKGLRTAAKKEAGKGKARKEGQVLRIQISDAIYARLERFSNAKYGKPYYRSGHPKQFEKSCLQRVSNLVGWMASEYFKEHKPDLEAMAAAADAKDAASKEETRKRVAENEQEKKERTQETIQPGLRLQRIWPLASEDSRTRALSSAFDDACKENCVRGENAKVLAAMTDEERNAINPENYTM